MKKAKTEINDTLFYTKLTLNKINYNEMIKSIKKRKELLNNLKENNNIIPLNKEEDNNSFFFSLLTYSLENNIWISKEIQYFKYKINKMNEKDIENYFYKNFLPKLKNFNGEIISINTFYDSFIFNNYNKKLKSVYFLKVIDLISKHKIIPLNGFVNFNKSLINSILISEFRYFINSSFKLINKWNKENIDERIYQLKSLEINNYFNKNIENSKLSNVLKCLPPCIWEIIQSLKLNGHIFNYERLIINRFFYSMGINIEELISFLKKYYKINEEQFNKEYIYNIRHVYGLEGKKANYKNMSCKQIISSNQQCSGCPFFNKTYEKYFIENKLIDSFKGYESPKLKCSKVLIQLKTNLLKDFNQLNKHENELKEINSPNEFCEKLMNINW